MTRMTSDRLVSSRYFLFKTTLLQPVHLTMEKSSICANVMFYESIARCADCLGEDLFEETLGLRFLAYLF